MTTKRNIGLSVALALASGAAMAAPPVGFTYNDYTVSDGTITAGACPVGFTCETVQEDPGFLQQRISDGTAVGTFFRTIVLAEDATAETPEDVEALAFRLDTFAGAGAGGATGNVAALGRVSLSGDIGSGTLDTEIAQGAWNDDEAELRLQQNQSLGDRTVDFQYLDTGSGVSMRMDQINPGGNNYSGPMTVRRTTGDLTVCETGVGCILELPDGQQLTYDSGDSIAVMYQHQALFGMGNVGAENRVFENQRFTVGSDSIVWTNAVNHVADGGAGAVDLGNGAVIGGVTFNTVNADGDAWDYWDDNFGTAPTGVTPPAAFPADPFDP